MHVVHSVEQPTVAALVYNESFSGKQEEVPKPPVYIYGRELCCRVVGLFARCLVIVID